MYSREGDIMWKEYSDWDIRDGFLHRCYAKGKYIEIPENVRGILPDAFCEANIHTLKLPAALRTIMPAAFRGSQIQNYVLPDNLNRIEANAFAGSAVSSIALPKSLVFIGESAFEGCSDLRQVSFSGRLCAIGGSAFAETGLLHVELDCDYIGSKAFWKCYNLKKVVLKDSVFINYLAFAECRKLTQVELNEGLLSIGTCAFWNCESLKEVYIPDTVNQIGFGSFYGIKHVRIILSETMKDSVFDKGVLQYSWVPDEYLRRSKDLDHEKVREITDNAENIVFRKEK